MSDRCPLCDIYAVNGRCEKCQTPVHVWPTVAELQAQIDRMARAMAEQSESSLKVLDELERCKARIAELETVLRTMLDNCGCCEDVSPCSNCLRAEIALNPKQESTDE